MMKLFFVFFFGLTVTVCMSQNPDRILFYYDNAGNQTQRTFCINCQNSRVANETPKEIVQLEDEDLLKFSSEDVISYYPNPVKEELYLKWELINDNKVTTIAMYSLTGQLIKLFGNLEKENNKSISFQELPQGTYVILMNYANGEQKSITILKQ